MVTNSSWMDSSTNSRPAAIQFSPLLKNTAPMPLGSREEIVNIPWEVCQKSAGTENEMLLEGSRQHDGSPKQGPLACLAMRAAGTTPF